MNTKIKICGITNLADGRLALELGADMLGFNFFRPSPRYINPRKAGEIINALPTDTVTVGIFVNAGVARAAEVLKDCPLTMAQLHGDEDNQECHDVEQLGVKVIKALRMKQPKDIELALGFDTDMILLDAFREELYGGTGDTFDWGWIREVSDKKIFLAGGINPDNITEALKVGTYAVDLCSGVEKKPGIKDADKMKILFNKVNCF
ncbi:MAG: phosphoribosylanthranilate isomerase [Sedimentisphaerales bacterium]|nr:phosphoribosylanthranilate isomerase [Sedimentisphaerales bacterium]